MSLKTVAQTGGGGGGSGNGTVTNVSTGTGLTGGPITVSGTISLANTTVTAATYGTASTVPQIVINQQGQITSASNVGITIPVANVTGAVPNTVYVLAGTGIAGGGALTGNVTVSLASTAVTSGSYGNASTVGTFTVNGQGQLTAAANTAISIPASAINSPIPNSGLANSSITVNGTSISLGGSGTVTANTTATLTLGTGLTGTSFNGSTAVTANLANTTVTAGSYGNASTVGSFTVDAQGRLTAASNASIAIAASAITSGTLAVTNGGTGVTTSTGSGSSVLSASPTLTGTLTVPTVTSPAATNLTVQSAGTTAMAIDTSQNVGIGTTSPLAKLHVKAGNGGELTLDNDGSQFTTAIWANSGTVKYYQYWDQTNALFVNSMTPAGAFTWVSNSSERMRIASNGNLLIGTTNGNVGYGGGSGINAHGNGQLSLGTSGNVDGFYLQKDNTGGTYLIFYYGSLSSTPSAVGSITTNGTSAFFNTSSDYRLKNSVQPMASGLSTVLALRPVTYKWNLDNSYGDGFIAHELQAILPNAVVGEKNAVKEDGSIKPQSVDYSKIVVHLVAAIQELSAKNDALTARIAALEAK